MKIDQTLRELFEEIATLDRSIEEWVGHHEYESFNRGEYECMFIASDGTDEPMGWFLFSCIHRDYKHTAELTIEEVRAIANKEVDEITVAPYGGIHPEDQGMKRIEVDPSVLHNAIVDGINIYVRDVLRPRGIVDQEKEGAESKAIRGLKHDIARRLSEEWRVSWKWDE